MASVSSSSSSSCSARRLSLLFSSTKKPRTQPPKPQPAPTPKASTGEHAEPNPSKQRKSLRRIVGEIFAERDPDKLVSKFVASSAIERFRRGNQVYDAAVSRLAACGRHDAVEAIIEAQKPFLDVQGPRFAARLVRLYGDASMPSHAAATFHNLPSHHKTVTAFNALLAAYRGSGEIDALHAAFQEIPASCPNITPNMPSYNILINTLCQKSDLSAALDVIVLMEKRGLSPNVIQFRSLLIGFYNKGPLDDAVKVWEMMKERNVEPDTKCYNAKLQGLVAKGRIEDAAALIEMMEEDGPKPDTVSYNVLIRGYCKEGRLDDAKKVYDELVKRECGPNAETFRTIIPHLVKAGELDGAINCCHEILGRKCRVDGSLLQGVVTALVGASRAEEAKRIVDLGRLNHYSQKSLRMPDIVKNDDVEAESGGKDPILHEGGPEEEEEGPRNAQ